MKKNIGVLGFHGDVAEHLEATRQAAKNLHIDIDVFPVTTKLSLRSLTALIIPGGESTTLHKLCSRENMWEDMKRIKNIFGTCAGAIMLAKTVHNKTLGQQTLEVMDIAVTRNAYGSQSNSFETDLDTRLGGIYAVFVRAPKIEPTRKNVTLLAHYGQEVVACEQRSRKKLYIATSFHPELTSTIVHEYFLTNLIHS